MTQTHLPPGPPRPQPLVGCLNRNQLPASSVCRITRRRSASGASRANGHPRAGGADRQGATTAAGDHVRVPYRPKQAATQKDANRARVGAPVAPDKRRGSLIVACVAIA